MEMAVISSSPFRPLIERLDILQDVFKPVRPAVAAGFWPGRKT